MGFGNLKSDSGLECLNSYLQDRSYIEGFVPSQADVVVSGCLAGPPPAKFNHALRWFNQISSYSGQEQKAFPGVQRPVEEYGSSAPATTNGSSAAAAASEDEEDDFDLFGDDVEAPEPVKVEVKKKKQVVAKSGIVLDVKPWDDETDMHELEKLVRTIEADGLLWGASKLVPLAYGIKKLQISCVIEDEKISTDFLEESITGFEDHVQSMDIAAFNKI